MRAFVAIPAMIARGLSVWGCGGSGSAMGTSASPTSPTLPSTSGVVMVNVVAINGAQSFSPNPATLPAGQMVMWHNVDRITHRVVLNDRSVDTGDLAPGASSQAMAIGAGSGPYHCSIHPEMVGSINQDGSSMPPPPSSTQPYSD